MPITNYGIFKGHLRSCELQRGGPHAVLHLEASQGTVVSAAFNIIPWSAQSELVYRLDYDYKDPQYLAQLSALDHGIHRIMNDNSLSLDLFRRQPAKLIEGRLVSHSAGVMRGNIINGFINLFSDASREEAIFHAFGSFSEDNDHLHNIHLNQGNTGPFQGENAALQDGGILIKFPDGHWEAVLVAFASQASVTSNDGQPAGPLLGDCCHKLSDNSDGTKTIDSDAKSDTMTTSKAAEVRVSSEHPAQPLRLDEGVKDPEGIRNRTIKCLTLFETCQRYSLLSDDDWIDKMSAKFNWWSLGIGAAKRSHSSLDYRVQTRDDVRSVLISLLDSLAVSLQNSIEIAKASPTQRDDTVVSLTDEDSELGEQKYYIKTTLDFLSRISAGIRKSGTKFRHQRADRLLKQRITKFKDFRNYLQHIILIGPNKIQLLNSVLYRHTVTAEPAWKNTWITLGAYFKDVRRLTPVQSRLIQANLIRRNRFDVYFNVYRQKTGSQKTGTEAMIDPSAPGPTGIANELRGSQNASSQDQKQIVELESRADKIPRLLAPVEGSVLSSQPATGIGSFILPQQVPPQQAKSVGTRVSQGALKQDYPKCPAAEGDNFWCPFCAQPLDSSYADPKNTRRWRGHIAEDLSPYVCVYPDCDKPEALYATTDEWKKHLKDSHSTPRWICDPCWLESDNPGNFEFGREEDWYNHTTMEHIGEFEDSELPDLLESSQRMAVPLVACPLCYENTTLLQPETDKHIAEHLHSFAIQSLPWETIGLDDDTRASVGSVDKGPVTLEEAHDADENADWDKQYDLSNIVVRSRYFVDCLKTEFFSNISGLGVFTGTDMLDDLCQALDDVVNGLHSFDPDTKEEIIMCLLNINSTLEAAMDNYNGPVDDDLMETIFEDVDQPLTTLDSLLKLAGTRSSDSLEERWEEIKQASLDQPGPTNEDFESGNAIEDLKQRIADKRVMSALDDSWFLPEGCLKELVTANFLDNLQISKYFFDNGGHELSLGLALWIAEDAKKLFAIVTCLGLLPGNLISDMQRFQAEGFDDRFLPLPNDIFQHGRQRQIGFPENIRWTMSQYDILLSKQWEFLVPVFSTTSNYVLSPQIILPVVWVGEHRYTPYSDVRRVKIHPAHIKDIFMIGESASIALKEIPIQEVPSHWSEDQTITMSTSLRAVRESNHRHINTNIATFCRGSKCWFMSRWADGGNLADLWEDTPSPKFEAAFVRNVIEQLRGLADALVYLHTKGIVHGRLKPTNILRIRDGTTIGELVLSDIGMAEVREVVSHEQLTPSSYNPPEKGLPGYSDAHAAPPHDIWGLGCIFFELLIWMLYGYKELLQFRRESRDHEIKVADHRLIEIWIDTMSADQECTQNTATKDLLKLIGSKMVNPHTRDMFGIDSDDDEDESCRANALQVRSSLDQILEKAAVLGESYLGSPPRSETREELTRGLSDEFVRLNSELKETAEDERETLVLSDQDLQRMAQAIEDDMWREGPSVYEDNMKARISYYKNLPVAKWKEEYFRMKHPYTKPELHDKSQPSPHEDKESEDLVITDPGISGPGSETELEGVETLSNQEQSAAEENNSGVEAPDLLSFEKAIPESLNNRFDEFRELYIGAGLSTKLRYMGKTESDSGVYIVVECEDPDAPQVREFLAQEHLLAYLGGDFKILVNNRELRNPSISDSTQESRQITHNTHAQVGEDLAAVLGGTRSSDETRESDTGAHHSSPPPEYLKGNAPDDWDNQTRFGCIADNLQRFFPNVDMGQPILSDLSLIDLRLRTPKTSILQETIAKASRSTKTARDGSVKPERVLEWFKGQLIDKGTSSKVYLGISGLTGGLLAAKEIDLNREKLSKDPERTEGTHTSAKDTVATDREINILQSLDHSNIVRFLGSEGRPEMTRIFMEYAGNSVGEWLRTLGPFDEEVVASVARQTTSGLAYLHREGVIHRNLKANNLLLDPQGTVKISGFGYSFKAGADDGFPDDEDVLPGSAYWIAPEVASFRGRGTSPKVDTWSLACVVLQMFAGESPWPRDEATNALYQLRNSDTPPIPEEIRTSISPIALAFMLDCFTRDKMMRPTAERLLSGHPFLEEDPDYEFTKTKLYERFRAQTTKKVKEKDAQEKDNTPSP